MALREDGQVAGSVSGGCIEDDLVDKMRGGAMRSALPFLLTYGVTQDEARRYGLPCGGTMELMVEPSPDLPSLENAEVMALRWPPCATYGRRRRAGGPP
jgi:xanthine dehydrogenase accessory factor